MPEEQPFLILGVLYIFVVGLDLLHASACRGTEVFRVDGRNPAAQLWIGSRYSESLWWPIAPLFPGRKIALSALFTPFLFISALILGPIVSMETFPDCYVRGIGLTTAFKERSEYVMCFIPNNIDELAIETPGPIRPRSDAAPGFVDRPQPLPGIAIHVSRGRPRGHPV